MLSFGAIRITDWAALRLIVTTLVVLHLAAILDIVYMALTEPTTMISNTVLRSRWCGILVVWWAARRHQTRHHR